MSGSLSSMVSSSISNSKIDTGKINEMVKQQSYANNYASGVKNGDKKFPFYYDQQLNNQITSVTLHPNTITTDGGISWGPATGEIDEDGYRMKPIARAILSEDYQVAVSNIFSDFGSDMLGNMFNQFKPYAPYAAHLVRMLNEMNNAEEEMENGTEEERRAINSSVGKVANKFTNIVYEGLKDAPSLLNRNLVAQGSRFSYYSGTSTEFGNLSMKFTVFSDWDAYGDFITVYETLEELYPYCFGKFVKALDDNGNVVGTSIGGEGSFLGKEKDLINQYFGWQLPPGGYQAMVKDIDQIQYGTLKLKFGTFYSLPNLVIENAQFNFSKQMVKYVNGDGESDICPLYCDVILNFKVSSKFTDVAIKKFVSGESMEREKGVIETTLSSRLKEKKEEINNFLNGK